MKISNCQYDVLKALGYTTSDYDYLGAEDLLKSLGLVVIPKRMGRSTVPTIRVQPSQSGGFNRFGEGDVQDKNFKTFDRSKIEQWIIEA